VDRTIGLVQWRAKGALCFFPLSEGDEGMVFDRIKRCSWLLQIDPCLKFCLSPRNIAFRERHPLAKKRAHVAGGCTVDYPAVFIELAGPCCRYRRWSRPATHRGGEFVFLREGAPGNKEEMGACVLMCD